VKRESPSPPILAAGLLVIITNRSARSRNDVVGNHQNGSGDRSRFSAVLPVALPLVIASNAPKGSSTESRLWDECRARGDRNPLFHPTGELRRLFVGSVSVPTVMFPHDRRPLPDFLG